MFAKHSWYFRNALVRANYRNIQKGIDYSPIYLVRFFRNLLLKDSWVLKNRYLHIRPTDDWKEQPRIGTHKYPTSSVNMWRLLSNVWMIHTCHLRKS